MALKHKFKKTGTNIPTVAPSPDRTHVKAYKFKDGDNWFRFLPQPEDSPTENFLVGWEYSLFDKVTNKYLIYLHLNDDVNNLLDAVRSALFFSENAELKNLTIKKNEDKTDNPACLLLEAKPKVWGLAMDIATSKLELVKMPGTGKSRKDYKPTQGVGSKLRAACFQKDCFGNLAYGDLADIIDGRPVNIHVSNAGTFNAEYDLRISAKTMPLVVDDVASPVLDEIKPLNELVVWDDPVELIDWLACYLPEEAVNYLVGKKLLQPRNTLPCKYDKVLNKSESTNENNDNIPY
jgi:hypothetical protein